MIPLTRTQLKEYCLRELGFPVIDINIDDDQIEDRIDDALQAFKDYHYDGTENIWLAQKITASNISKRSIKLSDNIVGITSIYPISSAQASSNGGNFNMFDINYQIRLNDFYNLTSASYTYYVIAREHMAMLDMITTGKTPFNYNKKTNELNIAMDWGNDIQVDDYMLFDAIRIVDPESYEKVYNDRWLKKYTTQLLKKQWGTNLTKYGNYVLPGGIVVNGEKIYEDAVKAIEDLEEDLRETYELPPQFQMG